MNDFWDAIVLHLANMTKPAQVSLSEDWDNAGKTCWCKDFRIAHYLLPCDFQDNDKLSVQR